MPRRDGFPTNIEMLADFTDTARLFYIATFNWVSERGFHPGLIDKPLTYIDAYADHTLDGTAADIPNRIVTEQLYVQTIGEDYVDEPVPGAAPYDEPPHHIVEIRRVLRRPVSETRIEDGLDISEILVPSTVHANYRAFDENGELKRSTGSWDDRPSKVNIAAGKFLAQEALKHVTEHGVDYDPAESFLRSVFGKDIYQVTLGLRIASDLPLNGYEPRPFLEKFASNMVHQASKAKNEAEKFADMGAPASIYDSLIDVYERTSAAAKRAQDILDK